ncbi:MAG: valine--tRNA ligase, partial [Lentisphaerae bacterium]
MKKMMAKAYEPGQCEEKWYRYWEESGKFYADVDPQREPFTIVIPPPNVTGILTLGHVLNNTLQDILIRRERMRGFNTCWVPGTDHAGIATQARVEKFLKESENVTRHDLGREEFLRRVWQWKDEYGGTIIRQLRKLGTACDWRRERFTLDEGLS